MKFRRTIGFLGNMRARDDAAPTMAGGGDDNPRERIGGNGGPAMFVGGEGWVAIHRNMRQHWLVGFGQPVKPMDPEKGSLSRAEAWIDLIMECRYEGTFIQNGGTKMYLKPGQLVGAVSFLAKRWNWTPKTVRGFIDKLETDDMVRVETSDQKGNHNGKQAGVITVCNYSNYQLPDSQQGQIEQQMNGKQGANEGQTKGNNIEANKETKEQDKDPLPPTGGASPRKKSKRSLFTQADLQATDAAFALWSKAAIEHDFAGKDPARTDQRRARLRARLEQIGGIERFAIALATIPSVPFLMGRVAPKPGQDPFKLDLDRLLQTDGNLGDVLAKLIDKAGDMSRAPASSAPWWTNADQVAAITPDRWRALIAEHAGRAWPVQYLGPPPGSPRCVVPPPILSEFRLLDRYDENGIQRLGWTQ